MALRTYGKWPPCRAVALSCEPGGIWSESGALHAREGRWKAASADFAKAVALPSVDPVMGYYLALAHLADDDPAAHRKDCSAMMDRFAESNDPQAVHWLIFTCVAAPDANGDPSRLVRMLAKPALRDGVNPRVQAAALCREGRLEDALAKFQATSQSLAFSLWDHLFLAMIHHRLGHNADEIRRHLDEAKKWIDSQDLANDHEI
jgi:hypothetical protein